MSFADALKESFFGIIFLGSNKFALPTWVIRPMFFSQIFIIIYEIALKRFPYFVSNTKKWHRIDLILIGVMLSWVNYVFFAMFMGYWMRVVMSENEQSLSHEKQKNNYGIVVIIMVFIFGRCLQIFSSRFPSRLFEVLQVVFALIIFFCFHKKTYKILDNKTGDFLGRLSFPIYLLHMPIIHVLSTGIIIRLINIMNLSMNLSVFISFLITIVSLALSAILWDIIIDRMINQFMKQVFRPKVL